MRRRRAAKRSRSALWLLPWLLVLTPAPGVAQVRASAGTHVYTDSDRLTVVHPSVSASGDVTPETQVSAGYDADVISAATVDVRSSASVRPFEEVRHGARAAVSHAPSRTTNAAASYAFSVSPDHTSHTVGLGGRVEDDRRVHRVGLDLRTAYESIGRVGDPAPTGELFALGGAAGWTGVLAPWLVVDVGLALEWRHGYQASPYRFAFVEGNGQSLRVPERVPGDRVRGAVSVGARIAFTDTLFGRASYRFHADDWGVAGHTVDLRATLAPARGWSIGVRARLLVQRGASFYQGVYETLPDMPVWRTRDRELAGGWTGSVGLSATAPLFDEPSLMRLSVRARGEILYTRTLDTPLLPERVAQVAGLTLVAER